MKAKDIMTQSVVTIAPGAPVAEAARLMLDHRVSGIPVVDDRGLLVGIVTEGDLIRRAEVLGEHRSWLLASGAPAEAQARAYVKSHGTKVADVMSRDVVSVAEGEPADAIALCLESRGIKRVPVVRDGKCVGIVSRANLLRGLAAGGLAAADSGDEALRSRIMQALSGSTGIRAQLVDVTVNRGMAFLWGSVASEAESDAARVVAETTPGIAAVRNHLRILPDSLVDYVPE